MLGLYHARKLRLHELAIATPRWDDVHAAAAPDQAVLRPLRARDPARDFALRPGRLDARAGLPGRLPAVSRRRGELAIVLHTHMPYVEGFGTWPFGEEWLWEAMATCYLPLLDVLERDPATG